MDAGALLEMLVEHAEQRHDDFAHKLGNEKELHAALCEISSQGETALPERVPRERHALVKALRTHFRDDVSKVSLVLSYHFPEEFFFYRVCPLEPEIFDGLAFLAQQFPQLELPFDRVGYSGFERYLQLNERVRWLARAAWPGVADPQSRIHWFLYDGLARLFSSPSGFRRYWVMATKESYWHHLDEGEDVYWSGRKEMQPGDLVFFYRTAPRKAITDLYQVADSGVSADPWGAWDGLWVSLEKVAALPEISFTTLRTDGVLASWGVVRRKFQGVITEAVTHRVYNRLLELLPEDLRKKNKLEPEELAAVGGAGDFATEEEFEDAVVQPLLERMGLGMERQRLCTLRVGAQSIRGRVDFLVEDGDRAVAVVASKLKIIDDAQLESAVAQARSYALQLGLPMFLIAAPEGFWLYRLERNRETLVNHWPGDGIKGEEHTIKRLLLGG